VRHKVVLVEQLQDANMPVLYTTRSLSALLLASSSRSITGMPAPYASALAVPVSLGPGSPSQLRQLELQVQHTKPTILQVGS
jgi:hypothetical protein